jgi:mRNA-degrading endonuclease RelE of RelBE toxin-antitoxin system
MTTKSEKLLARLSVKQRQIILDTLKKLKEADNNQLTGMNIKPLKGHKHIYRARAGQYRIFYFRQGKIFQFLGLSKRDNQKY